MVIVSAHYGNWELLTICFGLLVTPVTMIVKSQKNKLIDQQINSWRTMHGNRIIYKGQALREGLRTLEQGGTLAILGDQSDPGAGFFVDFLGRKASLFLGPAFFALKARVPLFVAMSRKHGDGRYTIELKEIDTSDLVFSRNDIRELAQRYTRVIEYYIRQCPEEWLWLHDRWKRADP
jgi:KDO2-lipid IV(A) lauroyltransferase